MTLMAHLFTFLYNVKSLHGRRTHLVEIAPTGSTTVSSSAVHVASVHWLSTVHSSTSIRHTAHATSGRSSPGHHVSVGGSSTASAKVATAWEAPEGGRWQSTSGRSAEVSTGTWHWENNNNLLKQHFGRIRYSRTSCRP